MNASVNLRIQIEIADKFNSSLSLFFGSSSSPELTALRGRWLGVHMTQKPAKKTAAKPAKKTTTAKPGRTPPARAGAKATKTIAKTPAKAAKRLPAAKKKALFSASLHVYTFIAKSAIISASGIQEQTDLVEL